MPLVVAILGLIGTVSGAIAGVVITQRGQMLATVRRGSVSDGLAKMPPRTVDLRREAYIKFYAAVERRSTTSSTTRGTCAESGGRRRSTRATGRSTRSSRC